MTNPPSFSLKDQLFNTQKVSKIATEIHAVYPRFDKDTFVRETVSAFPTLALKERIVWMRTQLKRVLPVAFRDAVAVLLAALPAPCDPSLSDGDFGDFIYAPYADFVAAYGCTAENLHFSLEALRNITTRFSAEDAIRYFINAFPDETLRVLSVWVTDTHYHVRRLVSEGTRPKLPWSQKLVLTPGAAVPFLTQLCSDPTRFVTRSVANHLNDISKTNPALVLETLASWHAEYTGRAHDLPYVTAHGLRTLVKQGHTGALSFLGFAPEVQIDLLTFDVHTPEVRIGDALSFACTLQAQTDARVVVDYVIWFQNKMGHMTGKKVYKLKQVTLTKGETLYIEKRHPFRANMTTRALYPGEHRVCVQVNGTILGDRSFLLC